MLSSVYTSRLPIFSAKKAREEKKSESSLFKEVHLPYIPSIVNFSDLQNNKLYSEKEIECMQEMKDSKGIKVIKENIRTKKALLQAYGLPTAMRDVILCHDDLYAIYIGKELGRLGEGSYGFAKLAQHLGTEEFFVYKIVKYEDSYYTNVEFQNEVKALTAANQLVFSQLRMNNNMEFQCEMLIKMAPGRNLFTLSHSLEGKKILTPAISMQVCIVAAESLKSLHDIDVIHGDVMTKNCMYHHATGGAQFIDFGRAVQLAPDENENDFPHLEGTQIYYLAPEGLNGKISRKVDIFGLGIMLAELLQLGHSIKNNTEFELLDDMDIKALKTKIKIPHIDLAMKKMIERMINDNPSIRPSIEEALYFLYDIQKQYISACNPVICTAYLNLHDYFRGSAIDRTRFLKAMVGYNEVYLVDTNDTYSKHYLEIHRNLELELGPIIKPAIIQAQADKLELAIRQHIEQRVDTLPYSYQHFFVNQQKSGARNIVTLEITPSQKTSYVTTIHTVGSP